MRHLEPKRLLKPLNARNPRNRRRAGTAGATVRMVVLAIGPMILAGACGTGSSSRTSATTGAGAAVSPVPTTDPKYHPVINPAKFTASVTNLYFPLKAGTTTILEGTRDGQPQHTEMVVTTETKTIMGVACTVIRDTVTSNGALVEKTTDWYAQAADGDVWYFGETTAEYANGQVSSTKGSWEAGVDGALPGIIMKAAPGVGDSYRQEYRPGEAEDMARVVRLDPARTVAGNLYKNIVVTEDRNPLEPDKVDQKDFAPGVGLVYTRRIRTGHTEEATFVKTVAS